MNKEILTFEYIEIEKKIFYCNKTIFWKDVDAEKVLVSNKITFGEKNYKYFIVTCIMIIKLCQYV